MNMAPISEARRWPDVVSGEEVFPGDVVLDMAHNQPLEILDRETHCGIDTVKVKLATGGVLHYPITALFRWPNPDKPPRRRVVKGEIDGDHRRPKRGR